MSKPRDRPTTSELKATSSRWRTNAIPAGRRRIRTLEGELIDTARTDIQGHFRGRGDFSGTALIKVYVLKRDLDPGRDHKHLCKGDGPEFEKVQ